MEMRHETKSAGETVAKSSVWRGVSPVQVNDLDAERGRGKAHLSKKRKRQRPQILVAERERPYALTEVVVSTARIVLEVRNVLLVHELDDVILQLDGESGKRHGEKGSGVRGRGRCWTMEKGCGEDWEVRVGGEGGGVTVEVDGRGGEEEIGRKSEAMRLRESRSIAAMEVERVKVCLQSVLIPEELSFVRCQSGS